MDSPACDICGEPATHGARDLRETEPIEDKDGRLWANWESDSPWRWRCDEHPTTTKLTGPSAHRVISMEAWHRPFVLAHSGRTYPLSTTDESAY